MKVSDYRDLIDALSDTFASLRSVANDDEYNRELVRVMRQLHELVDARCPRASVETWEKARRLIASVNNYINKPRQRHCFRCQKPFTPLEKPDRAFCWTCTNADCSIAHMAFGKAYLPFVPFSGKDAEQEQKAAS